MEGNFYIQSPIGQMHTKEVVECVPIDLVGHIFPTDLLVHKNQDIDMILGMNWLCQRGALIDTLNRTIQLNSPDNSSKLLIHLPTPKRAIERVYGANVKDVKDIPIIR
jgi:hypothetical protein